MNRSALKYLIVGLLIGGLFSSGIDASAIVSSGSTETAASSAACKKKKKATKKKTTTKKKAKKRKPKPKPKPVPAPTTTGIPLVGLFKLNAGAFAGGQVSGSYVRLILPNGNAERGPFFANPNSRASSYTLLSPGIDGGLKTGAYQEPPTPAFSRTGDALANRIMTPQRFAFILYSVATAAREAQTGLDVPPPAISVHDGKLSGQLQAFTAQWNNAFFNQGSPKPDGSSPGLTRPVTGTYNADTKAFTLEWVSQIQGGPFNSFSGLWHLEGTFEPRC